MATQVFPQLGIVATARPACGIFFDVRFYFAATFLASFVPGNVIYSTHIGLCTYTATDRAADGAQTNASLQRDGATAKSADASIKAQFIVRNLSDINE